MNKISTVAIEKIQIFKGKQLTIGLDLGDRTSHYCVLNEAGEGLSAVSWSGSVSSILAC